MAQSPDAKPVIVIAGPTACGKSQLAADVAERFGGVVINADSMQVYRGLEILSSAPDATMRARVPHRLYGVLDPMEACSAGRWRDMAVPELEKAHREGRLPVVVGGTGLYLRTLMAGIAPMPPVPTEIRERVRSRMTREGSATLHVELSVQDPETAGRLEPADRQRIARALEILEATGRTLTSWQRGDDPPHGGSAVLRFFVVLLMPPRKEVYETCDRRFVQMLEGGALDEVRRLGEQCPDPDLPAMKALGVPCLLQYLAGGISREEACRLGQQATRRYAKRQMTWFRHQIIADFNLETQYNEKTKAETFSEISTFLLTCPG